MRPTIGAGLDTDPQTRETPRLVSARKAFILGAIVGAGVLAASLAGVGSAARQDDGGSGIYGGTGTTLTFDVVNSGTTSWKYIVFVLPFGINFVSGQVTGGSPPCTVGNFVPGGGELECGEFSPPVPGDAHVTATATITAPVAPCGSPVQFYVNSTGTPPYRRASDLTFSGSCTTPGKNCDQEQARVASTRLAVEADKEAIKAADAKYALALQEAKAADADYHRILDLYLKKYGSAEAAFVLYTTGATDASIAAEKAAAAAKKEVERLEAQQSFHAGEYLDAVSALQKCEGQGYRIDAPRKVAGRAGCGNEGAALAGAQARALVLRGASKQLEATKLRAAELQLSGAIAGQIKLIANPRVKDAAPKLRAALGHLRTVEAVFARAVKGLNALAKSAKAAAAGALKAKAALAKCNATPPPPAVSISEQDTWTYNTTIGKANICINVKTTPPQASISVNVTGPNNYTASLPETALHPDGTRQIGALITQPGSYTDNLTVYDATGKQTATTTNTFTVAPPPQDGPTPTFGPSCPKPTG
jgi:hypothetical protein